MTRALGFAYRIYLSRAIDAEALGIYQIALSVFTVLVTITSSGVPVTVSRTSAKYRTLNDYKSANGTVMSAAASMFILACAVSIIILIFQNFFSHVFTDPRCLPIFLSLIPAFIASSIYSAFRGGLWGQKAFVAYSLTELIEEIILILFGVILTLSVDSVFEKTLSAAAAISISYCVAAVIAVIIYIRRGGKFSKFNNQ
ncbi:MAG: oligosaccharide flippase family protein [Firmicutes bacterium]|nr:oligosaccharide flippase family protein [Bacillota bacterium]